MSKKNHKFYATINPFVDNKNSVEAYNFYDSIEDVLDNEDANTDVYEFKVVKVGKVKIVFEESDEVLITNNTRS